MVDTTKLKELTSRYSACDISDCLLKLKVPGAGFLPDIFPLHSFMQTSSTQHLAPTALPLSTILFVPKSYSPTSTPSSSTTTSSSIPTQSNIPSQTHWTDLPAPNTLVLIQQPKDQSCAVVGDILATRLKLRGVAGILVDGRIRDLGSMSKLAVPSNEKGSDGSGFCVWNKGTSTVGSGLEAKAWASDVPLVVGDVVVRAGDIAFVDPLERGIVIIPLDKVDALVDMLPAVKAADDAVVADVESGVSVQEAFKRHRG